MPTMRLRAVSGSGEWFGLFRQAKINHFARMLSGCCLSTKRSIVKALQVI